MSVTTTVEVLVIGAGVGGLVCAKRLIESGATVRLLEKSRGVGGRCATRRLHGQPVDHGLAFYHGDDRAFLEELHGVDAGIVEDWPRRVHGRGTPCQPRALRDSEMRLAYVGGVTEFPKHLARGLDVELQATAVSLDRAGSRLRVSTTDGRAHEAATVVMALPAPQAIALAERVDEGRVVSSALHLLRGVATARCMTLIAGYRRGETPEEAWDVLYPENSRVLQMISLDSGKRRDPEWVVTVLQAHPAWSAEHWSLPTTEWAGKLLAEARRLCGTWADRPAWTDTQRWRHARLVSGGDMTSPLLLPLEGGSRLGIAGEAFAPGGGVQAAWRSGVRLAKRIGDEG